MRFLAAGRKLRQIGDSGFKGNKFEIKWLGLFCPSIKIISSTPKTRANIKDLIYIILRELQLVCNFNEKKLNLNIWPPPKPSGINQPPVVRGGAMIQLVIEKLTSLNRPYQDFRLGLSKN